MDNLWGKFRLTLAAAISAGLPFAVGAIEIASGTLTAVFDDSGSGRGRMTSLKDRSGREFVSQRIVSYPLWRIETRLASCLTNVSVVTAVSAKRFMTERKGDALHLVWEDVGQSVERAEAVFMVRKGCPDIRCRMTATPKPGWALVETQFPLFALNEVLGTTDRDDALVMGSGHGGLVRQPMKPGRLYWKNRLLGHSPGNLVAQFAAYFDDMGGLFTMAEDADGNEKELLMDRFWRVEQPDGSFVDGDLLCRWSRFEYSESTDAQPYDIVLRGFSAGDGAPTTWHDAADIYKEWAERQAWCAKKFLDKTDFLPQWTREAPVVMEFSRDWLDRPGAVRRWLKDYYSVRFPGAPLVAIVIGWEKHGDWIGPDYFPVHPSEQEFASIAADIRAAGGHVWLWPSGHRWNLSMGTNANGTAKCDISAGFRERAAPHAIVNPDGRIYERCLPWLKGGTSATMCPGDKWTVDWWNHEISCALVKRGADLVQADQDVGARLPTCWSSRHGHKPGPGRWTTHAQRRQFETMLAEMRKTNPGAMFSFEEMHEFFNDIYAFADYRNCRWTGPEWASVWNYLYHEYVPVFQSGREMYRNWFWLVFCAVDGQMPRLPVDATYYVPVGERVLENGDFEKVDGEGKTFQGWENPVVHEVVSEGGSRTLRLSADGTRRQVARNIDIKSFWRPGRRYRFRVRMKSEGGDARNGVTVAAIAYANGRYGRFGGTRLPSPAVSNGWIEASGDFMIEQGAEKLRVMVDSWSGSLLVDDMRFEEAMCDGTYSDVLHSRDELSSVREFCEHWIRLHRGEGRPYLAHGRQLHPPRIVCSEVRCKGEFRGDPIDSVRPLVYGTAWRAEDGSEALCFGNADSVEQPFSYLWKGTWNRMVLKPRELRLVRLGGRGVAGEDVVK